MRSLGVVTTSSILVTIVVTCVAATVLPAMAVIEGLWIVGVGGADPDSVSLDSQKAYCTFDSTHTSSPTFTSKDLSDWPRVDEDLDVLASSSLTGNAEFSPSELSALVAALDINRTNLLGVDETDLQLIINYLSVASSYDSTAVDTTQFILFPSCADDELAEEYDLDHFDLYLVRAGVDDTVGCYDSNFTSPLEDVPAGVGYGEFHWNSFQVLDRGNATGDTVLWPVRAASGATHEAQHALWESDKCEHGSMRSHGDFNEFFASAASVMAKPPRGTVRWDKPYAQSVVSMLYAPSACGGPGTSAAGCPEWADQQDCRTGYATWGVFAAYLIEQFSESTYSDDLLYRWARSREGPSGQMTRDMCGLARVLDDSDYSALGGVDGDYRVAKVFHDFSVARWVNDDNHKAAYDFGDSISPTASFGYFAKNDTAVGGYNCYEIAVPPEFLVGGDHDSTWVSVPGNGSDPDAGCTDGWNDPRDTTYCDNTYCDPVKVRLWGSYYIGFAADTDYYDSGDDDRYLQIKVNWEEEAMHDSTELWVTVLKYNASEDSLFLRGDNVTWSATDQFSPSDSVVVNVTDFCEGGNEAAALVLSLVPTTFDTITVPCSYGLLPKRYNCMPRVAWDSTGARHDLPFEYSFAVLQEESGGSCPYRKLPRQADSS